MNLSVILPIDKIDDNLDNCIASVINQTEKNIELIISCSKKIHNKLKEKHKNIKFVLNDSNNLETLKNK